MANLTTIIAAIAAILSSLSTLVEAHKEHKTFTGRYGNFDDVSYYDVFQVENAATISNGALQLTPDSASAIFNLTHQSGRVLLKNNFKLWDGDDETIVASFNSSFLINIYRLQNETAGEGLAFLIAPDLNLPEHSSGEFLGLTNSSTDGDPSNKIVAVEIDTFKQDFDMDDNHIGINLHSVRSVINTSLTPYNITIAPTGVRFYNVWVDYDGVGKDMEVYISEQENKTGPTPPKPVSRPILSYNLNLRDHVRQYSYFGFSASTGSRIQLNSVLSCNLTVNYFPENDDRWLKIVLGAGIPFLVLLIMGASGFGYYCRRRGKLQLSYLDWVEDLRTLPGQPREFGFKDLKKATGNFSAKNQVLEGGYGVIHRGILVQENLQIAVKWFSRESIARHEDFVATLAIINRLRHRNLVEFLGWCHKSGKLLLVYEYMPKGCLEKHIFASSNFNPLPWNLRYNVASGLASALHYLHHEYEQKVVHGNIKASNIMVDSNFHARLGHFGLARAIENERTSYVKAGGVLGMEGYIAPECFHTGKVTLRSDVYAFGAVLLELVCGQQTRAKVGGFDYLVDWVWSMHRDGRLLETVDSRLGDEYVEEEAERLLLLGMACSHPIAWERPKTRVILQMITSKTVPVPSVPLFRPAFSWQYPTLVDLFKNDSDRDVNEPSSSRAVRVSAR